MDKGAFQSEGMDLNSQSIPVLNLSYYCKYENQKVQVENNMYKIIILFSLIQHNFLILAPCYSKFINYYE